MVNERAQLYTMEGVAAGLIMILTAYIVLTTVSIYTPGDTHIPDMQLEQLGSDVLAVMDTPVANGAQSKLLLGISDYHNRTAFKTMFLDYCNTINDGVPDNLHMHAVVAYRDSAGLIGTYTLCEPDSAYTGRESAVRVTRWVHLSRRPSNLPGGVNVRDAEQVVLVEVLLWR